MSTASSITIPADENEVTLQISDPNYDPTDPATPLETANISFGTDYGDSGYAAVTLYAPPA